MADANVYRVPCYDNIGDQAQTGDLVLLLIIVFTAVLAFIGMMDGLPRSSSVRNWIGIRVPFFVCHKRPFVAHVKSQYNQYKMGLVC